MTFEELYQAHAGRVLTLVYRMTGDEEAARDLTQDIFLKVHRGLAGFRGESDVATWIHRIAVNHALNHLKHKRRFGLFTIGDPERPEGERPFLDGESFWAADPPRMADAVVEEWERADIVWSAVRSLPEKYRIPLLLHHYEGIPCREVGAMMGLGEKAVETRIHRAKRQLVRILTPYQRQL